jgi:hypothetical protein
VPRHDPWRAVGPGSLWKQINLHEFPRTRACTGRMSKGVLVPVPHYPAEALSPAQTRSLNELVAIAVLTLMGLPILVWSVAQKVHVAGEIAALPDTHAEARSLLLAADRWISFLLLATTCALAFAIIGWFTNAERRGEALKRFAGFAGFFVAGSLASLNLGSAWIVSFAVLIGVAAPLLSVHLASKEHAMPRA